MNTRTFGVLVAVVLVVVVAGIATVPADAQSDSKETYVHEVDAIRTHHDGQICAEDLGPDVNRVTVGNSTHFDTTIYHHNTDKDIRIDIPKFNSRSEIVLYTDGSNPVVDALAEAGACTPPGMDVECTIVVNEYNLSLSLETPEGIEVLAGPDVAADPPEAEENPALTESGSCLGVDLEDNSSSSVNATLPTDVGNDTVSNTTDQVNDTVDNVTDPVNDTVSNTTDQVNDTVDNVTDPVNETTNPVKEVVDKAVETVESTVDTVTEMINGTNDTDSEAPTSDADSEASTGDTDSEAPTNDTDPGTSATSDANTTDSGGGEVLNVGVRVDPFHLLATPLLGAVATLGLGLRNE